MTLALGAALIPAATPGPPPGADLALTVGPAHSAGAAGLPTLRMGDRGAAVTTLQRRLRDLRAPVSVDGRFGPETRRAVQAAQAARGLAADGIVGPLTWSALNGSGPTLVSGRGGQAPSGRPTLRLGSTGSSVTEAQRLLTSGGHPVSADGRFGPITQRAVLAFQGRRGLAADGVVGPVTWAALSSGPSAAPALLLVSQRDPWRAIGARSYTVRSGDTLGSIASATGSTAAALAAANRLVPGSRPSAGTTILVPGSWRCPAPGGRFINDYGFFRTSSRTHEGVDLFAARGTPVMAPVAGRVEHRDGGLGGRSIRLHGRDGHRYYFAHLEGYGASGSVAAGEVIGYVGNSGNAITTVPHLHFEIHPGGGGPINPFPTLTLGCSR